MNLSSKSTLLAMCPLLTIILCACLCSCTAEEENTNTDHNGKVILLPPEDKKRAKSSEKSIAAAEAFGQKLTSKTSDDGKTLSVNIFSTAKDLAKVELWPDGSLKVDGNSSQINEIVTALEAVKGQAGYVRIIVYDRDKMGEKAKEVETQLLASMITANVRMRIVNSKAPKEDE